MTSTIPVTPDSVKHYIEPINETGMAIGWIPGRLNYPAHSLTLIIKGTFDLQHDDIARLVSEGDPPPLSGDQHHDDDPEASLFYESDFVHFKPRADVLLVGSCYVPGNEPTSACPVTFGVGDWHRTLQVIGQRFWVERGNSMLMSDPIPFRYGPIRYEYAFGGPNHPDNPLGKGQLKMPDQAGIERIALPNVEDPEYLLNSPERRPPPAGFGPLCRQWRARAAKTGTYDENWLEQRWPWYAEDLDWSFFNAAPPEQQLSGYLRGDETIHLQNLHREHADFRCRLPGLRIRGFVERRRSSDDPESGLEELQMRLDTLWVDAEQERLVLIWRGSTTTHSEFCEDIDRIFALSEPLASDAVSIDSARQQMLSAQEPDEDDESEDVLEIDSESEALEVEVAGDFQEMDKLERAHAQKYGDNPTESARAMYREQLVRMGKDPGQADEWKPADQAASAERQREIEAEYGFDEMLAEFEDEPLDRVGCLKALAQGQSLAERDLSGIDLSKCDLSGADFSGAILEESDLRGANLEKANLKGADLTDAHLIMANLRQADLTDADLTDARIMQADLRHARLDGATLERAILHSSRMDSINARRADFQDADLTQAVMFDACLDEADLSGCRLDGSRCNRSSLQGAHLEAVSAQNADFSQSCLQGTNFGEGCDLSGSRFVEIQADESIWEAAVLEQCDFSGASLRMSNFTAARMGTCNLRHADLAQATLMAADLHGANLRRANLFQSNLEKVSLEGADLRDANLYEAETRDAVFHGADLSGANVKMSKLA